MIKVFVLWIIAFLFLVFGISSPYTQIKAISAIVIMLSILYSERVLDIEYIKYHEKKQR